MASPSLVEWLASDSDLRASVATESVRAIPEGITEEIPGEMAFVDRYIITVEHDFSHILTMAIKLPASRHMLRQFEDEIIERATARIERNQAYAQKLTEKNGEE